MVWINYIIMRSVFRFTFYVSITPGLSKGMVLVPRLVPILVYQQAIIFGFLHESRPNLADYRQNTFITLLMTKKYQTHRLHRPFCTFNISWKLTKNSVHYKMPSWYTKVGTKVGVGTTPLLYPDSRNYLLIAKIAKKI